MLLTVAPPMKVAVRFYAELARRLNGGQRERTVELAEGSTVGDLLGLLKVPLENGLIVGLNGSLAHRAANLHDGDELELMTAMEGGSVANGYWARILRVDLTSGKTGGEHRGDAWYRRNIGGRAMIAHYLLSEVPAGIDAFDPENRLVFAAGVLTGCPFPGAGRHSVGAKSPLNGGFGESEAGGFWGAELKHAGWDGIVVQGRADKPVYLWITEDDVELHDAGHLWGKTTGDVQDALREAHD